MKRVVAKIGILRMAMILRQIPINQCCNDITAVDIFSFLPSFDDKVFVKDRDIDDGDEANPNRSKLQ